MRTKSQNGGRTIDLQFFGGRGASGGVSGGRSSGADSFIGRSVADATVTYDTVEELFGLNNLTSSQKNKIVDIFNGMKEYDLVYGDKDRPYTIKRMDISQPWMDEFGDPTIMFSVSTGATGKTLSEMYEQKSRQFLIGTKGGTYTYNNGRRQTVRQFEAEHGSRYY